MRWRWPTLALVRPKTAIVVTEQCYMNRIRFASFMPRNSIDRVQDIETCALIYTKNTKIRPLLTALTEREPLLVDGR